MRCLWVLLPPAVGHLSMEERPEVLLDFLASFARDALQGAEAGAKAGARAGI